MSDNAIKLLVALALFVAALGVTFAFAQDERPRQRVARLERIPPSEGRRPRPAPPVERGGESESCAASDRNGDSLEICVSPTTARVGEPVTVDVREADLGPDCGVPLVDFGDGSRSAVLRSEHRYRTPGRYSVRVVAGACEPDVRLQVTVRP